jgi:hypothetical protein
MLRLSCVCLGTALALFAAGVSVAQAPPEPSPIAPPSQLVPATPSLPPAPQILQLPTIQGPLPVRVVENPKTEAQFDAEQKEREARAAFSDQLLVFAALVVAVGAFLAIAFLVQAFYLGLGLRAIRQSQQVAERNIMTTQRAFVYIRELTWRNAGGGANVNISPIWANAGTTPTRRLRVSTNWTASHSELRPDFDVNYVRPPDNLFLGPGAKAEFGTISVPMRDVQAAIEERLHLYVWGRATYEDMFEGSPPHHFQFCHRLAVTGETPGKIEIRFTLFGLSNGSDQDSRAPAEAA